MSFTDEQIEKIVDKISGIKEDHDLLVTIATTLESMNKHHVEERDRTIVSLSEVKSSVSAAHNRIDGVVKFHWMSLGSLGTVGIMISIVMLILKLTSKL